MIAMTVTMHAGGRALLGTHQRWLALAFVLASLGAGAWLTMRRELPRPQPAEESQARRSRRVLDAPSPVPVTRSIGRAQVPAMIPPLPGRHSGDSEVQGRVVDAAGGAVPFAVVTARALSGSESIQVSAEADGAFRARVPAGGLELLASADAFSSALRRVEAPANGVLLELGPGSEIVGRVVEADTHAPLAGVNVTAMPEQQEVLGGAPPRESPDGARTSSTGEFRIAGLRGGGAYQVMVTDTDWQSEPRSVLVEVGAASEPTVLAARPAALLTARVLRDGEPCPEGIVRLAAERERTAPIGGDGVARFVGLRPGHYEVDVFCAQALPQHLELELEGVVTRELLVSSGLSVSGRVVDAKGRPLPAAKVSVQPRSEAPERLGALCSSDERGEFLCAGLEPGEHDCRVIDPLDAAAEVVSVALDEVSARDLVLQVRPLASVRVLLEGDLEARASARVLLHGATAFPVQGKLVAGAFVFERLPLGRYEAFVDQPNAEGGAAAIELTEDGQVLTLELSAAPRTFITGLVVDERGEPLGDQWVSATVADPLARSARQSDPQALSEADGAFTLTAVSGGVYDLSIDSGAGTAWTYGVAAGSTEVVLRVIAPTAAAGDERGAAPE